MGEVILTLAYVGPEFHFVANLKPV